MLASIRHEKECMRRGILVVSRFTRLVKMFAILYQDLKACFQIRRELLQPSQRAVRSMKYPLSTAAGPVECMKMDECLFLLCRQVQ